MGSAIANLHTRQRLLSQAQCKCMLRVAGVLRSCCPALRYIVNEANCFALACTAALLECSVHRLNWRCVIWPVNQSVRFITISLNRSTSTDELEGDWTTVSCCWNRFRRMNTQINTRRLFYGEYKLLQIVNDRCGTAGSHRYIWYLPVCNTFAVNYDIYWCC